MSSAEPDDLATTPWERLSRRVAYENRWIRVEEDVVRVPNGHETIYGVVRCADAVGVLPFVDDDHVLLVQQYRYVAGHPTWEMPTGGRTMSESLEDAARRELAEEAGFAAGRLEYLPSMHRPTGRNCSTGCATTRGSSSLTTSRRFTIRSAIGYGNRRRAP